MILLKFLNLPLDFFSPLYSVQSLHGGHVTPLIGGAFGECSTTIDDLLKDCALQAAAHEAGLQLTTSILSARNLLLHDFRQCTILRANVDCKLQRIPFIRGTPNEASSIVHCVENRFRIAPNTLMKLCSQYANEAELMMGR